MHAVVLVGGFGTRLRPLTNTVPKSMLPIAHVPLIVRHIGQLERGGVDAVTLALGFLPEPFVEAFPDGRCGGVELGYAIEPEPLDTAGAIRFAADHAGIDETFVVTNGDVLTDLSVADLVASHRAADAEATIHLIGVDDPSAFGVVEREPSGRIVRFVEKPAAGTEPSNLINAGTYVLEPSVLARIPTGRRASIERDDVPGRGGGRPLPLARHRRLLDRRRPARAVPPGQPRPRQRPAGRGRRGRSPPAPRSRRTPSSHDSVIGRATVDSGARDHRLGPAARCPHRCRRRRRGLDRGRRRSGATPCSFAPWSAPTPRSPTVSTAATPGPRRLNRRCPA